MDRIVKEVEEFGIVEKAPKREARTMQMYLAPKA
jgi:translation initiation factor IF-3